MSFLIPYNVLIPYKVFRMLALETEAQQINKFLIIYLYMLCRYFRQMVDIRFEYKKEDYETEVDHRHQCGSDTTK